MSLVLQHLVLLQSFSPDACPKNCNIVAGYKFLPDHPLQGDHSARRNTMRGSAQLRGHLQLTTHMLAWQCLTWLPSPAQDCCCNIHEPARLPLAVLSIRWRTLQALAVNRPACRACQWCADRPSHWLPGCRPRLSGAGRPAPTHPWSLANPRHLSTPLATQHPPAIITSKEAAAPVEDGMGSTAPQDTAIPAAAEQDSPAAPSDSSAYSHSNSNFNPQGCNF